MEYSNYFMLLKKYEKSGSDYALCEVGSVFGYAQFKKQHSKCSLSVVLNNYAPAIAYIVANGHVSTLQLKPSCNFAELADNTPYDDVAMVVPKLCLASVNDDVHLCKALAAVDKFLAQRVAATVQSATAANITSYASFCELNCKRVAGLEKIFGKTVLATYFFDYLKPKLAKIFAIGKPSSALNDRWPAGRWVQLNCMGRIKVVGILYYQGFPFAIGVGEYLGAAKPAAYGQSVLGVVNLPLGAYEAGGGFYNIKFFSAANGEVLTLPTYCK